MLRVQSHGVMSSPNPYEHQHKHKRRRTDQDGPSHRSACCCCADSSALVPVPVPAHVPLTDKVMREQLELSLVEMQRSTARIESLLGDPTLKLDLDPNAHQGQGREERERVVLAQLEAPSQPSASTARECTRCTMLSSQLAVLQAEAQTHRREREAWSAFKAWWLASLDQRQRQKQRARTSNKHKLHHKHKLHQHEQQQGQREGVAPTWTERMAHKLDSSTRDVWQRAGILPHTVDAERGSGKGEGGDGSDEESGVAPSEGESTTRQEQSEPALPLEPTAPRSPLCVPTSNANPDPTATSGTSTRTLATHPASSPSPRTAGGGGGQDARGEDVVGYVDTRPVRRAHQRRTLVASDCPECTLFYAHLNRAQGERAGDRERNACSRHRSTFPRPTTPEGYWDIGFPTTQQALQINSNAAGANRPP